MQKSNNPFGIFPVYMQLYQAAKKEECSAEKGGG